MARIFVAALTNAVQGGLLADLTEVDDNLSISAVPVGRSNRTSDDCYCIPALEGAVALFLM